VVVIGELAEADGAVEGPGARLGLGLPRGGQLTVCELGQSVDGGPVEPAAGAVLVRREEELLQLALRGAGAGVVALDEEAAQDVEEAGDEEDHGQHHRDEQHGGGDPRRHRRRARGRGRVPPRRRLGLRQQARHSGTTDEQEPMIGIIDLPREEPATRPPYHGRHTLGLAPSDAAALIHGSKCRVDKNQAPTSRNYIRNGTDTTGAVERSATKPRGGGKKRENTKQVD
jgi:hypothetical protein